MSIKCAHCGGRHAKLETVRQCAIEAGVKEELLPVVEREMWLPTIGPIAPVRHKPGFPPAGYFWLEADTVAKIRVMAEGRWAGRYFVSVCSKARNTEKLVFEKSDRDEFLSWLVAQGFTKYMARYGISTGYCASCGDGLTGADKRIGYHSIRGPYKSACYEAAFGKYTI